MEYPENFQKLIDCFKRLTGVGSKSAERMAYDVLNMSSEDIQDFIESLTGTLQLKHCTICGNCSDTHRDHTTICVVHYPKDVFAIEKLNEYHGTYHVLNGAIAPSKQKTEEDINYASLIQRVEKENIQEIILATNLTVEGEITAMFIANQLKKYPIKITRLAHGLPMGAQLDYADEMTLFKAFSNRKEI